MRVPVALLGRAAVPSDRLGEVADDTGAGAIHRRQLELRAGIVLLGRLAEPQRRGGRVARYPMPVQTIPRENPLGFEITGLGGGAVAVHCRILFGRFEMTLRIEMPELEEGRGVTRIRRLPDQ